MTPSQIILHKNLVASGISSAKWSEVNAALRDRAFFSSRVESLKFLQTCRSLIANMLENKPSDEKSITSRAKVVSEIMQAARAAGISYGTNSVTDPGSMQRANLIIDTNAAMAAGYASAIQSNTFGARLAFPAQELVRIEPRKVPRNWPYKWRNKGGKIYSGRMIALKEDPIWSKISAFGNPYPPFDFNSGMGVRDVSYDEALSLGVIKDDYKPPKKSPLSNFNKNLSSDCIYKNNNEWRKLRIAFGDQIRFKNDEICWRQDLIKDAFENKHHFEINVGQSTERLKSMMPSDKLKELISEKEFIINSKWLHSTRKNGLDHYSHFGDLENHDNNIPLTVNDLELMPCIFREPDEVINGKTPTSFINVLHDGINGNYCLIIDAKNQLRVKTFLKLKHGINISNALNK